MKNLLIIDTETTGLDFTQDDIIEIGAIFYNVPSRCIIHQLSFLICGKENKAEHINKISQQALNSCEIEVVNPSIDLLFEMLKIADAIIAHNAIFDKSFLEKIIPGVKDKKWICTKNDFKWPIPKGSSLKLIDIALEMGVPVVSAHRALTDCQLITSCFSKLNDLEERLRDACKERFLYSAYVRYEEREKAKQEGFSWNSDLKRWEKNLTQEEAAILPFQCFREV